MSRKLVKCLYGSQNYGLDHEDSDKDYLLVVLPTFSDLYYNRNLTKETPNDTKGITKTKDIRSFLKLASKNIAFIECLFSVEVEIYDDKFRKIWEELVNVREDIFKVNLQDITNSMIGMSIQKKIAIKKGLPKLIGKPKSEFRQKFGYDPKQLLHIGRILQIAWMYASGELLENSIWVDKQFREELLKIKTMNTEYDSVEKALLGAEIKIHLLKEEVNLIVEKVKKQDLTYSREAIAKVEESIKDYIKLTMASE